MPGSLNVMPEKSTVACFVAYFSPESSCTVSAPAVPVRSCCVLATSMLVPADVSVPSDGENVTSETVGVPTPGSTCMTLFSDVSALLALPAAAVSARSVIAAFRDQTVRRIDLTEILEAEKQYLILLRDPARFRDFTLCPGGCGLDWKNGTLLDAERMYNAGERLALSGDEIRLLMKDMVVGTSQACSMLGCSRQYADQLVQKGMLPALRSEGNTRLYIRSDVERLSW